MRGVGTLDGTNHPRVKITQGVGWWARFTGWTRAYGYERGPDAPAMLSGQMLKSGQTLAMAVGSACLLLKSSSSLQNLELSRHGCTVRVIEWIIGSFWHTSGVTDGH